MSLREQIMQPIGPPPDEKPENDFSDFMPTKSQIETAIAMYNGDFTVSEIRRHFAEIGCTPTVVDGLTTRVLELAISSLVRSRADEQQATQRLTQLGLQPEQIRQLLPQILHGQTVQQKHYDSQSDSQGLLMGFFAALAGTFGALFGVHGSHAARQQMHLDKMANHSGRKRKRR